MVAHIIDFLVDGAGSWEVVDGDRGLGFREEACSAFDRYSYAEISVGLSRSVQIGGMLVRLPLTLSLAFWHDVPTWRNQRTWCLLIEERPIGRVQVVLHSCGDVVGGCKMDKESRTDNAIMQNCGRFTTGGHLPGS